MSQQPFQKQLHQDLARLRRLLGRGLKDVELSRHDPEALRILDLACGNCHEAETLADYFTARGPVSLPDSESQVELVGVDIREREIADAQARCRDHLKALSKAEGNHTAARRRFEFLAGDATKVGTHREMREPFDLVFLRHQNFWHDREVWLEIFQQGLEKLSPGGTLVLTSYFDREHALALEALQHLGGEMVRSIENSDSRNLSTPGKSIDKHLAVFRKPR